MPSEEGAVGDSTGRPSNGGATTAGSSYSPSDGKVAGARAGQHSNCGAAG